MRTATNRYWIKAIAVSLIAFALGVAMYILVGIAVANGTANANAAWQQVTIQPITECDCVAKFVPEQPLPGSGTTADPFVTYNSRVPMIVGVEGVGLVTIEDQHGNVLWSYNKIEPTYAEFVAQVDLPDGLGLYELAVKLDGVESIGPNVTLPVFIDYRSLPLPPEPPDTGANGGYLYIGGYAVQTFGVLLSGLLFGVVVFFIFFIAAARKRKQEAENTRSNMVFGKAMRRQLSPKAIDQSGVIVKKSRAKKGKKKSR
ncbi:hypothetical protein FWF89_01840 [Candidatus Saccharibacteria bacterium]|nr:hypothetical protein [Candidatus Saccharibacteria bacterium]